MAQVRKPFQGTWNIVRFNWHFYLLSVAIVLAGIVLGRYIGGAYFPYFNILCILALTGIIISLLASLYIYDLSALYSLDWIDTGIIGKESTILNIHAGFDETSTLLREKFPAAELIVFDFYDPAKHTELSIKRARKAYPPFPGTLSVLTSCLPLKDNFADRIFLTLAAHEIRDEQERTIFFRELNRILKPGGHIIVTEHLRDLPNFLVYNIGFFHFFPRNAWKRTFENAHFKIVTESKNTIFIASFTLEKYVVAP